MFGGTLNLYGSFIFRDTSVGKDTMLAKIIQAVEDAQTRRAPIQASGRPGRWLLRAGSPARFFCLTSWAGCLRAPLPHGP